MLALPDGKLVDWRVLGDARSYGDLRVMSIATWLNGNLVLTSESSNAPTNTLPLSIPHIHIVRVEFKKK